MTALTHGRLKELLHYDPDTGLFTWIAGRRCGAVAVVNQAYLTAKRGLHAGCTI